MSREGGTNRIVFLSDGLHPGGTSEFVSNILEGLPAHGWRSSAMVVSVLAEIGEEIKKRGLEIAGPYDNGGIIEDSIGKAYRELARLKPKVVVASLGLEAFEMMRILPSDVLRVAMIQSDDPNVYATVANYSQWLDVVGCVSLRACERMLELRPDLRSKVEYLPYGVRMSEDSPRDDEDGFCRIIYLGRLIEEQKRMSLQLEVMEATLEANPRLIWTLAGDGPSRPAMQARLARWGERVAFLGQVPNQKIPALLRKQDLYFLCSDYEGLPLSLLEAMGAGVVPVVSDLPSGIRQVVDDRTGIRVDPNNPASYMAALLDLASNLGKRNRLSNACRLRVKDDYSIDAMSKTWAGMLDRRVESRHHRCHWSGDANVPALLAFDGYWYLRPYLRPFRRIARKLRSKSGGGAQ